MIGGRGTFVIPGIWLGPIPGPGPITLIWLVAVGVSGGATGVTAAAPMGVAAIGGAAPCGIETAAGGICETGTVGLIWF